MKIDLITFRTVTRNLIYTVILLELTAYNYLILSVII